MHLTGSALVVHPPTGRVLLRWHEHLGRYLHVGGHGDPGESDPYAVALREATEETGLEDLVPFPGPEPLLVQVAVVSVPERRKERAHEHADLRFLLSTSTPELAVPEKPQAVLVWRSVAEARSEVGNDGLGACLDRVGLLLAGLGGNADR
ncbi:MAG: hydrolase [Acidimicrobiaceae bacterium]|nr:hydrolase [Acidimicrobiaceae bacterium]